MNNPIELFLSEHEVDKKFLFNAIQRGWRFGGIAFFRAWKGQIDSDPFSHAPPYLQQKLFKPKFQSRKSSPFIEALTVSYAGFPRVIVGHQPLRVLHRWAMCPTDRSEKQSDISDKVMRDMEAFVLAIHFRVFELYPKRLEDSTRRYACTSSIRNGECFDKRATFTRLKFRFE